jgi:hypothetical protein
MIFINHFPSAREIITVPSPLNRTIKRVAISQSDPLPSDILLRILNALTDEIVSMTPARTKVKNSSIRSFILSRG